MKKITVALFGLTLVAINSIFGAENPFAGKIFTAAELAAIRESAKQAAMNAREVAFFDNVRQGNEAAVREYLYNERMVKPHLYSSATNANIAREALSKTSDAAIKKLLGEYAETNEALIVSIFE